MSFEGCSGKHGVGEGGHNARFQHTLFDVVSCTSFFVLWAKRRRQVNGGGCPQYSLPAC